MSDLHLERQDFPWPLPAADVLIIAGDLCHAVALDPARGDLYSMRQRETVLRFFDSARSKFSRILLIAGNHDHFEGVFEETIGTLRRHLPGVNVLDDEAVEIDGVQFFGGTLWTDFDGRSPAAMQAVRKSVGEFFFIKMREGGDARRARFRPEDALAAFDRTTAALERHLAGARGRKTVVVTHHAPSRKGLNPQHMGNGLDCVYASALDAMIAGLTDVPVWVHGHTHVTRTYRIGETTVMANCRGFANRDGTARAFTPARFFEV
jgi:Icc-related predicted phosphoesterase